MASSRFGHFCACLLAGSAFLFSGLLQAKPGLDHQYRGPHYNTEALQLDVCSGLLSPDTSIGGKSIH